LNKQQHQSSPSTPKDFPSKLETLEPDQLSIKSAEVEQSLLGLKHNTPTLSTEDATAHLKAPSTFLMPR
jgi:hypothetical protein